MKVDKKKIEITSRGVYYDGKKLRKLGSGSARSVYKFPHQVRGVDVVLKVQLGYNGEQNEQEYETYQVLRNRKIAKHIPKTFKPFEIQHKERSGDWMISCCFQELAHGKTVSDLQYSNKKLYKKIEEDCNKFYCMMDELIEDVHEGNIVYDTKKKQLMLVDFGFGLY